jgi:hypothetical protein
MLCRKIRFLPVGADELGYCDEELLRRVATSQEVSLSVIEIISVASTLMSCDDKIRNFTGEKDTPHFLTYLPQNTLHFLYPSIIVFY